MASTPSPAILLCDDMFFSSKVEAAGRAVHRQVTVVMDTDRLIAELNNAVNSEQPTFAVIVDLECRQADTQTIHDELAKLAAPPISIGYAGHRRTDLLDDARQRGFDHVLTRGQFDEQMPQLLGG